MPQEDLSDFPFSIMKGSTILSSAATAFACGSTAFTPITNRTNTGVEYVSGNYVPFQPGFLGTPSGPLREAD